MKLTKRHINAPEPLDITARRNNTKKRDIFACNLNLKESLNQAFCYDCHLVILVYTNMLKKLQLSYILQEESSLIRILIEVITWPRNRFATSVQAL